MKKMILGGIAAIVIVVLAAINVNLSSQSDNLLSDFALTNEEALANYEVGPILSNWKEYTIECTVTYGFSYGVVYTYSYTFIKVACGYGTGWCLSPAGC